MSHVLFRHSCRSTKRRTPAHRFGSSGPCPLSVRQSIHRPTSSCDFPLFFLTSGCVRVIFSHALSKRSHLSDAQIASEKSTRSANGRRPKSSGPLRPHWPPTNRTPLQRATITACDTSIADFVEVHGEVKIIAHFYNGDVNTEQVHVTSGSTISSAVFRDGGFNAIEDHMVSVSQGRAA